MRLRGGGGAVTPQTEYDEHGGVSSDEAAAIVMNVGRGPVIDEAAMDDGARTKQIRGAALDVLRWSRCRRRVRCGIWRTC